MYRPVFRLAAIFAFACAVSGITPEIKTYLEECKNEHNIDPSQIKESIQQKKLPATDNGKVSLSCFLSCVMKKSGVIKDGKLDVDKAMEMNKLKFSDPEKLEKANTVAKSCADVTSKDGNECSFAVELTKCTLTNALKLNLEIPWNEEE